MTNVRETTHHSVESLVEQQLMKWRAGRDAPKKQTTHQPTVSLSREVGAGGEDVAQLVARELGLRVWDHELVHSIAERADAMDALIEQLDERAHGRIEEFVNGFLLPSATTDTYMRHLTTVVHSLEHDGGALIVGRGAQFLVRGDDTLRVRVVASVASRVTRCQQREQLHDEGDAQVFLKRAEHERAQFAQRTFHHSPEDPHLYDLIVNTDGLTIQGAAEVVCNAYRRKFPTAKTQ